MSKENTATNSEKSTVDERVDKLEATMQAMATTLQAISLTLSNLTTSFVSSSAALVPTTPASSVLIPSSTIALGDRAKAPMVTHLQFPPIYENQPLVGESSSHAPQMSPVLVETSHLPLKMNNPILPTTTPLTFNMPPVMGQVPATQPTPSVEMMRPVLEDRSSREVDHKLQQLEEALKAMQGPQSYGSIDLDDLCYYPGIRTNFKFKQPDFEAQVVLMLTCRCTPRKCHLMLMMRRCSFITFKTVCQRVTKKGNETFKEFAQQWRSEAAKVIPPLTDSEICSLFLKSTTETFRACAGSTLKKFTPEGKKEDEEAFNHISTCHAKPVYNVAKIPYNRQPQLQYAPAFKPTTHPQRRPNFNTQAPTRQQFPSTNRPRQFTKLPIPYNELKAKEAESTPNITQNPLPPHDAGTMNMVALDEVEKPVLDNANFWSFDEFFAILTKYDLIQPIAQMSLNVSPTMIDDTLVCPYHSNTKGHTLQDCEDFQKRVKELQAMRSLKFMSAQESEKCIAQFEEVAVDDITDEICSDDEEDYFGFNNLFGPTNMTDPKERWRRMLAEKAFMEGHPNFHLVHHAKAPVGSHESMLLGTREEESLCDSWRNLTINALDEEELEFDMGVSLVNGSFRANWIAKLFPAAFISE
ncbi:hypothetical protein SLEP1_g41097 [Rubroshorea leprosula]|uniref:Uncharacterized protein n=1 Tax=Rubroshorea leprosula TaxID=152421 RepID=A0AAV5L5Y8_9ROSI|nr:hypothetical protein SLEP1_g41097 [Rubroshorea leprosula]